MRWAPQRGGCENRGVTDVLDDLQWRGLIALSTDLGHPREFFFRSADEDLDQAAAYPFMTPIFGQGVVFDASPERRKEMLHNQALRGEQMRHAATIEGEVRRCRRTGTQGEIDLLDFFAELTIYTSSACLIGKRFRESSTRRFAHLYHELERGTDPLGYVDPYAPIESFQQARRRPRRTRRIGAGDHGRPHRQPARGQEDRDMLDMLVSIKDEDGNAAVPADEDHRDVHLDDVRRASHQLGHRGLDADRIAAASGGLRRASSTSSTSSTPTGRR